VTQNGKHTTFIGVPVDYRDNHKLMEIMQPESLN